MDIDTQKNFGGRPRKQEKKVGEKVHLGVLVTREMKARLAAAAQHTGRSQSQEAELRLEKSFWLDEMYASGMLTASAMRKIRCRSSRGDGTLHD